MRQVLDDGASVLLAQTYDPYGSVYESVGAGETSFGFTGEQVDASGLVYLRARYYQPGMGRFLNADPSRQEMNPYQYAVSNPIMFSDPSGNYPFDLGVGSHWEERAIAWTYMTLRGPNIVHLEFDPYRHCNRDDPIAYTAYSLQWSPTGREEWPRRGAYAPIDVLDVDGVRGRIWELKSVTNSEVDIAVAIRQAARARDLLNNARAYGALDFENPVWGEFQWNSVNWALGRDFPEGVMAEAINPRGDVYLVTSWQDPINPGVVRVRSERRERSICEEYPELCVGAAVISTAAAMRYYAISDTRRYEEIIRVPDDYWRPQEEEELEQAAIRIVGYAGAALAIHELLRPCPATSPIYSYSPVLFFGGMCSAVSECR